MDQVYIRIVHVPCTFGVQVMYARLRWFLLADLL